MIVTINSVAGQTSGSREGLQEKKSLINYHLTLINCYFVSDFGTWVLGLGSWVLGLGSWVLAK